MYNIHNTENPEGGMNMRKKNKYLAKMTLAMAVSVSMVLPSAVSASVKGERISTGTNLATSSNASDKEASGTAAKPIADREVRLATDSNAFDWETYWEDDLCDGDIETRLDFSSSDDPAEVMEPLGGAANIEGPLGSNCALEGASGWWDNDNLKVVDLAAQGADWNGAEGTATQSLSDTNVFRFFLHDYKDYDRNTNKTDRQRVEIRTASGFSQGDDYLNSYAGDVLTNRWKFYLPTEYELPESGSFFHIYQTKAVMGDEASLPVFTLSLTNEKLFFYATDCGHAYQNRPKIVDIDVESIRGKWIEAEVTIYTADKGHVYVSLRDVSDPENPDVIAAKGMDFDTWRRPEKKMENGKWYEYDAPAVEGQMNRTKWGLYRSNKSPKPFSEMVMYLGDLQVIKRGSDYVFPDGFTPNNLEKEVTWVTAQQPVEVLLGTKLADSEVPKTVEYYVDGYDKRTASVTWDDSTYNSQVLGSYTVYGALDLDEEVENPKDIRAAIEVVVVKTLSAERINWALSKAAGGTAQIKTICGGPGTDAENLIDGDTSTSWITDAGLLEQNQEDNGGYRYWAAIDLGAERTFDEIYCEFGTIGLTRWYRLKYIAMYMTDEAAAWEELISDGTGNPRENNTTPDPLATKHGSTWEMIPGVRKNNTGENGELCNNVKYTFELDEPASTRYVLLYGEIETEDCTPGIIQARELKLIGTKSDSDSEPDEPTADPDEDPNPAAEDDSDEEYSSENNTGNSNDGRWERDEKGWKYHFYNGTSSSGKWFRLIWNGKRSWYHFGEDGYMTTGWYQNPSGRYFYLNPVSDGNQGEMFVGWHRIDGIWYYFREIDDDLQGALEQEDRNRQ